MDTDSKEKLAAENLEQRMGRLANLIGHRYKHEQSEAWKQLHVKLAGKKAKKDRPTNESLYNWLQKNRDKKGLPIAIKLREDSADESISGFDEDQIESINSEGRESNETITKQAGNSVKQRPKLVQFKKPSVDSTIYDIREEAQVLDTYVDDHDYDNDILGRITKHAKITGGQPDQVQQQTSFSEDSDENESSKHITISQTLDDCDTIASFNAAKTKPNLNKQKVKSKGREIIAKKDTALTNAQTNINQLHKPNDVVLSQRRQKKAESVKDSSNEKLSGYKSGNALSQFQMSKTIEELDFLADAQLNSIITGKYEPISSNVDRQQLATLNQSVNEFLKSGTNNVLTE